ncbi:MAG: hypothetical protein ABIA78_00305 [archaeon]
MKIDTIINMLVLVATLVGFIIGFVNSEFRILAWSISFTVVVIILLFLVVRDYIFKIDENVRQINILKKDLNMIGRLSNLEGKFEVIEKKLK